MISKYSLHRSVHGIKMNICELIFISVLSNLVNSASFTHNSFLKIQDGTNGGYAGDFTVVQSIGSKIRCGILCQLTSTCWIWAHAENECRVYHSFLSPLQLTSEPTDFSFYIDTSLIVHGHLVPPTLVSTWVDAEAQCAQFSTVMTYEPDAAVMAEIHSIVQRDTFFVGLTKSGTDWTDGKGNVYATADVYWEDGQPDGSNQGEDATLSYKGEIADIVSSHLMAESGYTICEIDTIVD